MEVARVMMMMVQLLLLGESGRRSGEGPDKMANVRVGDRI